MVVATWSTYYSRYSRQEVRFRILVGNLILNFNPQTISFRSPLNDAAENEHMSVLALLLNYAQEHTYQTDCNFNLNPSAHQGSNFMCLPFYKALKNGSNCSSKLNHNSSSNSSFTSSCSRSCSSRKSSQSVSFLSPEFILFLLKILT